MTLDDLIGLHQRAATYPGQGVTISVEEACFAGPFCRLAPELFAAVEALKLIEQLTREGWLPRLNTIAADSLAAISAKLEVL
jgi:hypothetical protein